MKLLFCEDCFDIFKLSDELRQCKCGKVKGKYIDRSNAVVNGKGHSIAIGNGSLIHAIADKNYIATERRTITRKTFINNCSIDFCWVRPHEGEGNPHTKIDENL